MSNNKSENIKMNRKYYDWCKHAEGKSDITIKKIERNLYRLTDFMGSRSYKSLTSAIVISYKDDIRDVCSIKAYCTCVKIAQKFLSWLMSQPGYKSRITTNLIAYMSPTTEEKKIANQSSNKPCASIEAIKRLHDAIPENTEIDKRDRAAIALLITTGIRHKALIKLPIGCININKLEIDQAPTKGVKTKFTKHIKSKILEVDNRFIDSIKTWYNELRAKGFRDDHPFIPKAKPMRDPDNYCYITSTEVIPEFLQSHQVLSDILKKRCDEANIPYINPHQFRHSLTKFMVEMNLSAKERKCYSQNLGHEG